MLVDVIQTQVFAARPGGGNPCPVVPSADVLTDAQMLALARRFGLDTVFILTSHRADIRLRYFVPDHEMGISGHATVAALIVQNMLGHLKPGSVVVETTTGLFRAALSVDDLGHSITLEQNRPIFGACVSAEAVAETLGVDVSAIAAAATPIQSVSVSRPKLLVPLVNVEILDGLSPRFESLWKLCDRLEVTGLYPFVHTAGPKPAIVQARQFPLRAGFPEDAATGVAAGGLGAYLARYELALAPGVHRFKVGQGYAMGHPSLIETIVECEGGAVVRVAIEGSAQIVSRETIAI
jgi:PhzF family phenazine biosynthesis protein